MFGPKRLLELTKQKGKKNYRKDTKLNIVNSKILPIFNIP